VDVDEHSADASHGPHSMLGDSLADASVSECIIRIAVEGEEDLKERREREITSIRSERVAFIPTGVP
jgi:hypothetical protein